MKPAHVLCICVAAVLVVGCQPKTSEPQATVRTTEPSHTSLDELDTPPPQNTAYADDPYARDLLIPKDESPAQRPAATETARAPETTLIAASDSGTRTHVVQKGDTLFSLARLYYNDQTRWKEIWEANRVRVKDPDRIEVGTRLIIP